MVRVRGEEGKSILREIHIEAIRSLEETVDNVIELSREAK